MALLSRPLPRRDFVAASSLAVAGLVFGCSRRSDAAPVPAPRGKVLIVEFDDSGKRLRCAFCPDCGTRLWHEPESGADWLTLKGGSLDQAPDLSRAIHIWTSRKLPGVIIPPGAQQFPEEPV